MAYVKLRSLSRFSGTVRRCETIEGLNCLLHIGWKRRCVLVKLTGGGVTKAQSPRMQHDAGISTFSTLQTFLPP